MSWQVIGISNPAQLSLKDYQLVIKQEETVSIPIEDIDALVLDSYGITVTANLINHLSSSGTSVVVCDDKHLPASVILPYSQHSRQAKVSRQQLAMSRPFQKQLWRRIIVQKIINQATILEQFNHDATPLINMAKVVKSGDSDNRESQAARLYFSLLLDDATRRKPMWHNSALNYGYAMVRSHIARHIAARGLIASQGIFHRNELNSFNLADDIIETFRPAVDKYILTQVEPLHIGQQDSSLTKEDRHKIVDILNYSVIIEGRKYPIRLAIERTTESFIQAIESGEDRDLSLPSIISRN